MMPPDLQRIKHILDYCREVEKTVARYGNSFEIFDNDPDYQRSVSFCILQIGELSGGLSQEYRKSTLHLMEWSAIKGMRNLVAHNYGNMSRAVIWDTAMHDIPALRQFCEEEIAHQET